MKEDTSISFLDLLWSTLRQWRVIILVGIVVGIVLSGTVMVKDYRIHSDQKTIHELEEAHEAAMDEFTIEKDQLEKREESLKDSLEKYQYYQDNAIMLLIDQYQVYVKTASFYIDTDYQVSASLSFQNPNLTNAICNSYKAALDRLDLDAVLAEAGYENITTVNPTNIVKQLLNSTVDTNNELLQITIYGDTQERVDVIYDAVLKTIRDQEETLKAAVGNHTINLTVENTYTTVDLEFGKIQNAFGETIGAIKEEIANTKKDLEALREPAKNIPTLRSIAKKGIKYGIVGFLAGIILSFGGFFVVILLQDNLISTNGLFVRYQIPVLGIYRKGNKRLFKPDAFLLRKLGVSDQMNDEEQIKYISSNIGLFQKDEEEIVLIGNVDSTILNDLQSSLKNNSSGESYIVVGGNVNNSYQAIEAIRKHKNIICVEELNKTAFKDIRHELQLVAATGTKVLGFIVTC